MNSLYFQSVLIFISILNEFQICLSEQRIAREEWQQKRFGELAMDSEQWDFNVPEEEAQVISTGEQGLSATLQTNIETVDVGRDKLVLVNDQGTIRMLKASQLPSINKQSTDVTTQTPSTVIQMPLEQYLSKDSNQNPTKNPIEIIGANIGENYGSGQRINGLPVAFASSTNTPDRPNVVYQSDTNPCVKGSEVPPIYIPAPKINPRTVDKKMVRVIIEMPESMTRNPDEASRYAASQVRRIRVADELKAKRKVKKNIHEVIRKVVQTEEENNEPEDEVVEQSAEDRTDESSNTSQDNKRLIIAKTSGNDDSASEKKYILIRRSGKNRRRDNQRRENNLKSVDKYKKIIKVYRD